MSTLQGKYLRDTYKDLLQISNSNIGVDDTARFIEDGEGTPSILAISTSNVGVGTDTPAYTLDVAGDINLTGSLKVNGADAVFSNWTVNGSDIYRSSGNVGIGVTNPVEKLHVQSEGGSTTEPNVVAVFQANTTDAITTGGGTAIKFRGKSSGGNYSDWDQAMIASYGQPTNNAHGIGFYGRVNANTTELQLQMLLAPGGNVGIGTAVPDHQLTIKSSLNNGCIRLTTTTSTDNHIRYDYPSDSSKYWLVGVDQTNTLADSFLVYNSPRSDVDLIIDQATGNVGIGTTTLPQYKLTIAGGHLQLHSSTHLTALDGNAYRQAIGWNAAGSSDVMNAFINCEDVGNWGGRLQFWTRGEFGGEAVRGMTIYGGNVGIGTASPASTFTIASNSNTGSTLSNSPPFIAIENTRPDYTNDFVFGGLAFTKSGATYNQNGNFSSGIRAGLVVRYDGDSLSNTGTANVGLKMDFHTAAEDAGNGDVRMRIDSSGYVGIGKNTPTTRLDVANDFERVRMSITSNSGPGQVAIGPSSGSILVLAHVARAANANSNRSYLLLVNTRHWSFGGGNNVSVVNSTGSSTGTTGEPSASFGLTGSANSHYLTCSVTAVGGVQEEYYVSLRVISLGPSGL